MHTIRDFEHNSNNNKINDEMKNTRFISVKLNRFFSFSLKWVLLIDLRSTSNIKTSIKKVNFQCLFEDYIRSLLCMVYIN